MKKKIIFSSHLINVFALLQNLRYKRKQNKKGWIKVRYACRKVLAEKRERKKGRFIKANDHHIIEQQGDLKEKKEEEDRTERDKEDDKEIDTQSKHS